MGMPHSGINITVNGQQVPTQNLHYQQMHHYGDSGDDEGGEYYEEEEEEQLDEDGQPLLSPEQIRDVINSIPSFRFEQTSRESSRISTSKAAK